jgi:outer membrane immunogenic protein
MSDVARIAKNRKRIQRMRKTQFIWLPLTLAACSLFAANASAQSGSLLDAGVNYNYARTNAAPGDCGCINLQGGSGWVGYNFTHSFGVVGEVASQHASNISPFAADLTLTSFLGGVRYKRGIGQRLTPFGQVLLGGVHASGSMAPGNSGIPGSPNAFAMAAGGGIDLRLSRHFAFRMFQADYYYTRLTNGVNDHQNNLRIGAGLLIRLGSR